MADRFIKNLYTAEHYFW